MPNENEKFANQNKNYQFRFIDCKTVMQRAEYLQTLKNQSSAKQQAEDQLYFNSCI